jgi:hypothetical protein
MKAGTRKWLKIGAGTGAGIVGLLAFFQILIILYGFQITDLTGDIYCYGSFEDPCISEFDIRNPNPYYVDIYNQDQVKLDFSPEIEDYALFVQDKRCTATGNCRCELKDGRKIGFEDWRCVDFTNKTKPRKDKEYNFRFPAYTTKHFLIAGIKKNLGDVKWGISLERGELDPIWKGLNLEDYKLENYSNVWIAAEKIHSCAWKPDEIDDGFKVCEPEIIVWNRRNNAINFDNKKDNFDFKLTRAFKNDQLDFYYSTNYTINQIERLNETISNLTYSEYYNITKIDFTDWKEIDNLNKNIPQNKIVGIKAKFEIPKNAKGSYNFTYKPLNMLLDPDIDSCGTLSSAGSTYTMNASIEDTDAGDCIIVGAANITFDCDSYWLNSSYNVSAVYSNKYNTTVKNCNIDFGDGSPGYGIEMETTSAEYFNIINNSIYDTYYGLELDTPDYGTIYQNTIKSTNPANSICIRYFSNSYSNFTDNDVECWYADGASSGTYTDYSTWQYNNFTNYGGGHGFFSAYIRHSTIRDNIFWTNQSGKQGMYTTGSNNTIINNTMYSLLHYSHITGCATPCTYEDNTFIGSSWNLYVNAPGNSFLRTNITPTSGNADAIFAYKGYTTFRDCIEISSVGSGTDIDYYSTAAPDFRLINCSIDSEDVAGNSANELIIKWYYQAYVNYSNGSDVVNGYVFSDYMIDDTTGLVLQAKLDNDSRVGENDTLIYDHSGTGNNGTVENTPTIIDGKQVGGFQFNGDAGEIDFGDDTDFEFANNFTVSLWVKYTTSASQAFISKWTGLGSQSQWWIGELSSKLQGGIYTTDGGADLLDSGENFNDDEWHHIVMIRDNTTGILYVDAVEEATTTTGANAVGSNTAEMIIGNYDTGAWNYTGNVDEVLIFTRALTITEVRELYHKTLGGKTNASGYTPKIEITDYLNNAGTVIYFNNYTLNATDKTNTDDTTSFNASAQTNYLTAVYTITAPAVGPADINYIVALSLGLIRFANCSPDSENADSRPIGQTTTIAAINATNNGSASGNFSINLTGSLNNNWSIWASNDTLSNNITLSTTAQTIWFDVAVDETKKIWLAANCSYVTANPGQSISMQVA